jgi:hypothetical protein
MVEDPEITRLQTELSRLDDAWFNELRRFDLSGHRRRRHNPTRLPLRRDNDGLVIVAVVFGAALLGFTWWAIRADAPPFIPVLSAAALLLMVFALFKRRTMDDAYWQARQLYLARRRDIVRQMRQRGKLRSGR